MPAETSFIYCHNIDMPQDRASHSRRAMLLMGPAAFAGAAQIPETALEKREEKSAEIRLPNGKRQVDEILKADHEQNLREARDLSALSLSFESELEKTGRFILSLSLLKKLDEVDRLVHRLRARLKK